MLFLAYHSALAEKKGWLVWSNFAEKLLKHKLLKTLMLLPEHTVHRSLLRLGLRQTDKKWSGLMNHVFFPGVLTVKCVYCLTGKEMTIRCTVGSRQRQCDDRKTWVLASLWILL